MELNRLYNMDCMDGMNNTPDNYFDLAIIDPPYGINMGKFNRTNKDSRGIRHKANKYKQGDWDNSVPSIDYFRELCRISKEQIIWEGNYYFDILGNSKGLICWYKHQPVDNFADCEYAWTSIDKPAKVFDYPYYGNIDGNTSASKRIHPTQKPVQLYKWLLRNYATPDMKILSTHVGSGSDIIAFEDFGCEYVGYEIDKDYYDSATKRINEHKAQIRLFNNEY